MSFLLFDSLEEKYYRLAFHPRLVYATDAKSVLDESARRPTRQEV